MQPLFSSSEDFKPQATSIWIARRSSLNPRIARANPVWRECPDVSRRRADVGQSGRPR